jgi:hypothetical protein
MLPDVALSDNAPTGHLRLPIFVFSGYENKLDLCEWDIPCGELNQTFITEQPPNSLIAMRKLRRAMRMDRKRLARNQEFKRFETIGKVEKQREMDEPSVEMVDSLSSSENLDQFDEGAVS